MTSPDLIPKRCVVFGVVFVVGEFLSKQLDFRLVTYNFVYQHSNNISNKYYNDDDSVMMAVILLVIILLKINVCIIVYIYTYIFMKFYNDRIEKT